MRRLVLAWLGGTALACSDQERGTFRGTFVSAFEVSAFRQCGSSTSWWLTDHSHSVHSQLPPAGPPDFATRGYLKVRGLRSSKGSYGHLGAYPYEISVTEVLEASADTTGKCR
jgi:hypothetical protein